MEPRQELRNGISILGMHRTGTSLVAGILNILGVELGPGEDMMPATQDNPKGYWEQRSLTNINDELLEALGGSWDRPPATSTGWETAPHLEPVLERAAQLLRERFEGADAWGWKDPRNSLTLPFWQRLVPGLRYVVCVRNPLDVAESLRAREGEDPPIQHHLGNWLRYTASALEHTSGRPRLVLHFEDLLDESGETLRRLARFVGREDQLRRPTVKEQLSRFCDSSLQYSHSGTLTAMDDPRVPHQVSALYGGLRLLADREGAIQAENWRATDKLARSLRTSFELGLEREKTLEEVQVRCVQQEQALGRTTARLSELEALVTEQRLNLERRESELELQSARIVDLERLGDAQRGLTEDQRARIAEQRKLLQEVEQRLAATETQLHDAELRLEAQAQVAEAQAWELQARDQHLESARKEIEHIEQSFSWRVTRPLRWTKRVVRRNRTP